MFDHFLCQEFEKRNETPPESLIKNKPGAAVTEPNLLLKKAQVCHAKERKDEMFSTLQKLPKDEQISFLQRNGYVNEAADEMIGRGEIYVTFNIVHLPYPLNTHILKLKYFLCSELYR